MSKRFNLVVVGTNFIVPKFIDAALRSEYFSLYAIVSRKSKTGDEFRAANSYDQSVVIYDNFDEMLGDSKVDVVYLASPNSLHFSQAEACIKAGKAVFVEKPFTSNARELASLVALAKEKNVLLLDGMKSLLCPNFQALVDNLPRIGRIRQMTATFSKVSSRYQAYLDGNNPNTFNPEFSNGSVMDLGVYCIYPFVKLFDSPGKVHAFANLLDSGVDAAGIVLLEYPEFQVSITHSKVCATENSSEIQGEQGTIVIGNISTFTGLMFIDNSGVKTDISVPQDANSFLPIAIHLGEMLSSNLIESPVNTYSLAKKVMKILDEVRRQTGVVFPADQ